MIRTGTIAALATALALSAAPVRAQENADPVGDALEWLTVAGTQLGLVALRLVADVEFGDVEPLPGTGGVLVTDLRIAVPVPYARPRECTVTIGSYEGQQSALAILTGVLGQQSLRMTDVNVPLECLPPEARALMQVGGLTEIAVEELRLATSYDVPTAEADISLSLAMPDIADLELRGLLDYAFVRMEYPNHEEEIFSEDPYGDGPGPFPVPAIEFGPIDFTLTDRGLSERAVPFLQMAGLAVENVPQVVGEGVRGALGPVPLADDVEAELARFLTEGGRLSIALRPGTLWADELEGATPPEIVEAFNPSVGADPRPDLPDAELLAALVSGELDDAQRVTAARAFIDGDGLPRDPGAAVELLSEMAEPTAEARMLIAEGLLADGDNAPEAYQQALLAGAASEDVGALLRRAEARLTPAQILEAQNLALGQWTDEGAIETATGVAISAGDTETVLSVAKAYESGVGAVRSYERALGYALLADAAGEVGARPLLNRIERRLNATEASREAWSAAIDTARERASDRWIAGGMAAALAALDE